MVDPHFQQAPAKPVPADQTAADLALTRIDAALARIELAAERLRENRPAAENLTATTLVLQARHRRLREAVRGGVEQLDQLIAEVAAAAQTEASR